MNTSKILSAAKTELGTKESPANSNNVKYNTWFYGHPVSGKSYPWCMAFVQWCYQQAGLTLPYKTASCSALLNWYRKNLPDRVFKSPEPGDIIIYNFGHTGIVESIGKTTITAIEGNTSPGTSGSQSNGGMVCRRTRSKSLVTAYIRPFKVNLKENEEDDMDINRFKELWKEMRKELQDNDAGAYSKDARAWAVNSGLIQGSGTDKNGQPNYMWEDFLTRQQMVTLLYRFAKMLGKV